MRSTFLPALSWALFALNAASQNIAKNDRLIELSPWSQIVNGTNACGQSGQSTDHSGYIRVQGANEEANMFFWFFEARHDPDEAPVILYLNGGPGLSSIYRILDGTGPCVFPPGAEEPVFNPRSFNEYANVLYVDQPVGTGFSFGSAEVLDTARATDYLFAFLQAFYKKFPQFRANELGIWTSDFGSAFGATLALQILVENERLGKMKLTKHGHPDGQIHLNLTSLGMESPRLDPVAQLEAGMDFLASNRHLPVLPEEKIEELHKELEKGPRGDWIECAQGRKKDCMDQMIEYVAHLRELTTPPGLRTAFDLWDVRNARYGTDGLRNVGMRVSAAGKWLRNHETQKSIGVTGGELKRKPVDFAPWNTSVAVSFWEFIVFRSLKRRLDVLMEKGIRTLIVGGDADFISSSEGLLKVADSFYTHGEAEFQRLPLENLTWHASVLGKADKSGMQIRVGEYKTAYHLSYASVLDAGHVIAESKPEVLTALFWSHVQGLPLDVPLLPMKRKDVGGEAKAKGPTPAKPKGSKADGKKG